MFAHLGRHLLDRDGAVVVAVHLFEEKLHLILGDVGVDVVQELSELWEGQLVIALEAETV